MSTEGLKLILTGATGLVGEGVLMECLENPHVTNVLVLGRRPTGRTHAKLSELVVPDFFKLEAQEAALAGYDGCLYCAGKSSAGMNEADYTRLTYDTALHVAQTLVRVNPKMVFAHVSGKSTDGTGQGRVMWARVKGRTENALAKLPFKAVYNFRPGLMKPTAGQQNVGTLYKVVDALSPVIKVLMKDSVCTMKEVGQAMINSVRVGAQKTVLEVPDIIALAKVR